MAHTAQADANIIAACLLESSLPAAAGKMLAEGLPHAVAGSNGRHVMQEQYLELLLSTLKGLELENEGLCPEVQGAIDAARDEIEQGIASVAAAEQAERAAAAAVEEKAKELERRSAALAKTNLEKQQADAVKDRVMERWQALKAQRSEVSFLLEGQLRMLRDGGWEDDEARDSALEAVAKLLEGLHAEPALVAALPKALSARPAGRQEFDELAVAAATRVLEDRVSSLAQQLEAAVPEREAVTAEVLGLFALGEQEKEEEVAARVELSDAREAFEAAAQARGEAEAEVKRRQEALSGKLAAQVLHVERMKRLGVAREAAERLVANEYGVAREGAGAAAEVDEASKDAKMAGGDVEMSELAPNALEPKGSPLRAGSNPLGVATPLGR